MITLDLISRSVESAGLDKTLQKMKWHNELYFPANHIHLFHARIKPENLILQRVLHNTQEIHLLNAYLLLKGEEAKYEKDWYYPETVWKTLRAFYMLVYPTDKAQKLYQDLKEQGELILTPSEKKELIHQEENLQNLFDLTAFNSETWEKTVLYKFWKNIFCQENFQETWKEIVQYNLQHLEPFLGSSELVKPNKGCLPLNRKYYLLGQDNSWSERPSPAANIEHLLDLFNLPITYTRLLYALRWESEHGLINSMLRIKSQDNIKGVEFVFFSEWKQYFSYIYDISIKEIDDFFQEISLKEDVVQFATSSRYYTLQEQHIPCHSYHHEIFKSNFLSALQLPFTATYQEVSDIFLKLTPVSSQGLVLEDFNYLEPHLTKLSEAVNNQIKAQGPGLDILVWGAPGLGKTELVKALAAQHSLQICDLSLFGKDAEDKLANNIRLKNLGFAKTKTNLLTNFIALLDEAEDILAKPDLKHIITQELSNKKITTFWIINDLKDIHEAYLRRFDYIVEMSDMPLRKRIELAKSLLSKKAQQTPELSIDIDNLAFKIAQAMPKPSEIQQTIDWCAHTKDYSWLNIHEKIENYQKALLVSKNETEGPGNAEVINPTYQANGGFQNFAGYPDIKKQASYILDIFKHPAKYAALGGKVPKGVLLSGPAGVGKTMFVKCLAQEVGVPIIKADSSVLAQNTAKIKELFSKARNYAPCIIFIDELDVLASNILDAQGNVILEKQKVLNPLLVELDGFNPLEGILVVGATHRATELDPAVLRSGRFGTPLFLHAPHTEDRKEIFKHYVAHIKASSEIDYARLAKMSSTFTSSDISLAVNEAALLAAQKDKSEVDMECLVQSVDKIFWGTSLESMPLTNLSKWKTAVHEAGHALLAIKSGLRPQRATIRPHADFLGMVQLEQQEGNYTTSLSHLKENAQIFLGGRQAEILIFGEHSSGVSGDLAQLNKFLGAALRNYGMGSTLGAATLGSFDPASDTLLQNLEKEKRTLIDEAEKETVAFLEKHRRQLLDFAKLLLEKRSLDQQEMLEWFQHNIQPVFTFQYKEDSELDALIEQSYQSIRASKAPIG